MYGKVVLITGANRGIGRETARALAEDGAAVVMACRDLAKAIPVCEALKKGSSNPQIEVMHLDLACLDSIHMLASDFARNYDRLDVLLNNAGTFTMRRQETHDGFEMTMGVNYLGPFLLTHLLLPLLKQTPQARIVNVSSDAHYQGRIDLSDLQLARRYRGFQAYANSKLAIVLFTLDLANRLLGTGVSVNALHPGHVGTGMWSIWPADKWYQKLLARIVSRFTVSAEEGAQTSIFLARSPQVEGISGKYFDKMQTKDPSPICNDAELRRGVWQAAEALTGSC